MSGNHIVPDFTRRIRERLRMKFDFYIETKEDLKRAVLTFGFVPLFKNSIPGFSVEEHVSPRVWFNDSAEGVWEWKGPVIRECGCAYGKFFENKAVFVSGDWFPDFANYRRNGYDFDARYDDGLASFRDKTLYELVEQNEPVLSKELKRIGRYGRDGRVGFETIITRLQAQCYVVIRDFVYETDRAGKPYGWGVAQYATPESALGEAFTREIYRRKPEESHERILTYLTALLPDADEKTVKKLLRRKNAED